MPEETRGAGLVLQEETGFIGSEAVAAARAAGTAQKLVAFALTGPGIPRRGNPIIGPDERPAGVVTSGTLSPCLEKGIGMGYLRSDLAEPGMELEINVRGKRRPARVESRPLLRRP